MVAAATCLAVEGKCDQHLATTAHQVAVSATPKGIDHLHPHRPRGGGDRPRGLVAEEKSDHEEVAVSAICLGSPGEPRDQQSLANLCHCHSTILM